MKALQSEAPTTDDREETMDSQVSFIRVEHLTKVFHTARTRRLLGLLPNKSAQEGFRAVDDVSFEVQQGQTFVIMGLSGSGKSTIIRMINRLIDASDGSITVDGKDVRAESGVRKPGVGRSASTTPPPTSLSMRLFERP